MQERKPGFDECFPHSLTFKSIIAIYVDVTDVIWRKLMRSCLRCLKLVKCLMEVVFEMKIVVLMIVEVLRRVGKKLMPYLRSALYYLPAMVLVWTLDGLPYHLIHS